MRCPNCNAWATPDLASCGECGAPIAGQKKEPEDGGSLFKKYKKKIDTSRAGQTNPFDIGGTPIQANGQSGLAGSFPSVPAIERAMAEEITLDAESHGVLNLLLLHAGFSPFKRVAVRSHSRDGLSGTRLRVTASPAVIKPLTVSFAEIGGGQDELEPPLPSPDQTEFFDLDEAVRGQLDLAVLYEDTALAERSLSVTVQTANEWIGLPGVEASLACLVTPNAPAVVEMVNQLSGDFAAYQAGDPRLVLREVEEVYEGIRGIGLHYVGVPPSFEGTGQKVLFPDEVISSKRGCCIDIAVLTASLLERIGYNPLIVVVAGHAYSGVWTAEIRSKTPIIRDVDVIHQAIDEGDMVVWNSTTYFDRDGDDGIGSAVEIGIQYLDEFEYAIDIAACRAHEFKPLPRRKA